MRFNKSTKTTAHSASNQTAINKDEVSLILSMYNDETRYIDELLKLDTNKSYGFYKVQNKDTQAHFSFGSNCLICNDNAKKGAVLNITEKHTKGHFTKETGISVLPGYKMIAASAEMAIHNLKNRSREVVNYRLAGISGSIKFKIPVLPKDNLLVEIVNANSATEKEINTSLKINNIEIASVSGLKFKSKNSKELSGMGLDRLIEAAAQTLYLTFIHNKNIKNSLPLFSEINGPVEYYQEVFPGQLLKTEAVLKKENGVKQFIGDVIFRVGDKIVASIQGVDCKLFTNQNFERVIKLGRIKLG